MFDILFDAFVDLVTFFPSLLKRRIEKGREWSGTVEKKKAATGSGLSKYDSVVIFRLDDGGKKTLRMRRDELDLYRENTRYTKEAGADLPDPASAVPLKVR